MYAYERHDGWDPMKGLVAGVIGGVVGTLAMEQFQALVSTMSGGGEEQESGEQESGSQREQDPTIKAGAAVAEPILRRRLTVEEEGYAGQGAHWAMGVVSGAIYGVAAEVEPTVHSGFGVPFGAAVWLLADDTVVPALGLTPPATQFPASVHANALAAHLVYGVATEATRNAVRYALG